MNNNKQMNNIQKNNKYIKILNKIQKNLIIIFNNKKNLKIYNKLKFKNQINLFNNYLKI